MYLFCPRCNSQHLASSRCPRCSARLLSPGEAHEVLSARPAAAPPPPTPTATGRVIVGTIVALGLHLALREWVLAGVSSVGVLSAGAELWVSFALRAVGTVVGGLLSGAGRPKPFGGGTAVGAACGVAWLAVDAFSDLSFDLTRLGAAGGLLAVGGVAAMVGGVVWPTPVEVKVPEASRGSSLLKLKPTTEARTRHPIGWVRIVLSVTLAVCGVLAADLLRQGLVKMPDGFFKNLKNAPRTDAQIAGFVCVFAGVVAGAASGRGWRQGLIAGIVTALGVVGVSASLPDGLPPAVQYTADILGFDQQPKQGLAAVGAVLIGLLTAAGWFGGQLLPPLRKDKRLGA